MKNADIVILGGSAAGVTAALTAKRHHPRKSVLVIRKEKEVLIPCGIPYIFGTVGSPSRNLIPDALLEKAGVEILQAEALALDLQQKSVVTDCGAVSFERLILATGSDPSVPPIPGTGLQGVFPIVKDIPRLLELQQALESAQDVVIIGGGFIGIEFADEIRKRGIPNVTIVEIAPHCLSLSYDTEFCEEAEEALRARGVQIRASTRVQAILGEAQVEKVLLGDGGELKADVVILGAGALPNVQIAQMAGLELGTSGAIRVDRAMRTSEPGVFACGDCAKKHSFFGGRPSSLKLASIATMEARIAGANLYGITRENSGTIGVWSTAIGDLALGTAGLTETAARGEGYEVVTATVEGPNRHPGGMPGGAPMKVKLVFEASSGVMLGGQVRGNSAAGELLNVMAACVQQRMHAEDIAMFQMGTHPALTASPVAYPLTNAAEIAIGAMRNRP
ncbi:FAD-dependent oxidoreductase [Holophaga foetida]|uniref:FAD-dependent oxidoreductase n=1 Tax=Holophaga foetida TaxID=35839 RepID=UPI0002475045|nr:FAD-dependent oxidoreductase [Holophaga foetida]